jgi:hypothetical protein
MTGLVSDDPPDVFFLQRIAIARPEMSEGNDGNEKA